MSLLLLMLVACTAETGKTEIQTDEAILKKTIAEEGYTLLPEVENINDHLDYTGRELRKIYFAGGCFWGVEAFMQKIYGVSAVFSGYANGSGEKPSYEDVIKGDRGFVEAVEVIYDPKRVTLEELLDRLFLVIDPTIKDRQGNDVGIQYRTGIYYDDENDAEIIREVVENEQKYYKNIIVTETEPLEKFYLAEEFHQDYLAKNPNGYCHINLSVIDMFAVDPIEEDRTIVKGLSE